MTFRVSFRRYTLPFEQPIKTAHGLWPVREGVIIRLEDMHGNVGFGEAAPVDFFDTESLPEIVQACGSFGEYVEKQVLDALPGRYSCLRFAVRCARTEIEAAQATADVNVGLASTVVPYLPVAALLPAGKPALARVEVLADSGFRVFKWKVGVADPADEMGLLDDLLARMPGGAKLRLDANGAWDRRRAEKWLERCAERPIEFVEQPIAADARNAEDMLLGLAGEYPTPIALDESIGTGDQIERWISAGWPGVYVVKPSLLAEPERVLVKIAKAPVVFSSAIETAVGARAALMLAFRYSAESRALGFGVWPIFQDSRFDGPMAAPFIRREDVERLDPELIWNALS